MSCIWLKGSSYHTTTVWWVLHKWNQILRLCLTRCLHTVATCFKQHMIFMSTSQNTYLCSPVRGSILQLFKSSQVHCQPIKFLRSNCVFDAFPSECPWNGDFHNKSVRANVSPVYSLCAKMWKCVSPLLPPSSQGPKQANLTAHTWACWTSSQNVKFLNMLSTKVKTHKFIDRQSFLPSYWRSYLFWVFNTLLFQDFLKTFAVCIMLDMTRAADQGSTAKTKLN